MEHLEEAARHISAARQLAVRVALDDFGTGNSSLTLLRSLVVDELKVDRSFVSDIVGDKRDMAIVRAMTSLGRDLGLLVVAEGVETLAQAARLAELRCDRAQGFLWSPAVPLGEFRMLLRSTFPIRPESLRVPAAG
jgi:EAL domain-containing protein (putative c-di-GMP-specific phosphodiesterase class I)